MGARSAVCMLLLCLTQTILISRAEIVTLTTGALTAGAVSVLFGAYTYTKCKYFECCDTNWITANVVGGKNFVLFFVCTILRYGCFFLFVLTGD